jgi:uncharacterized caspase-like protein
LVVGNSAYKSAPLRNPTNDAKDMAAKLKGMGFSVIERNNLTVKQIGSTLREFPSKLTPGGVALVYYAGRVPHPSPTGVVSYKKTQPKKARRSGLGHRT